MKSGTYKFLFNCLKLLNDYLVLLKEVEFYLLSFSGRASVIKFFN